MQVILGIIAALIVAWLGYFALGLVGQFCILALDTMARGFGVNDPVLGWIFVGVVFGAIMGLRYGLRRAGAPISRTRSALLLAIPAIVLGSIGAARSSLPSHLQHTSTAFVPIRPVQENRDPYRPPVAAKTAGRSGVGASQTTRVPVPSIPVPEAAEPAKPAQEVTAAAPDRCYGAEGISCTIVPEQEQQPIQEAYNSSLDAVNQRDIARAHASVSRASQLLEPWLQRSPDDPWVARTSRHLNTISSDIRTVCNSANRKGEQLPGC
ncbi:MAG: hypothetical protein ACR2M1_07805 [Gemmatimonadaceae bacterium]